MKTLAKILPVLCVTSLLWAGQFVAPAVAPAAINSPMLEAMGKEIAEIAAQTKPAVVRIYSTSVKKQKITDPMEQMEDMFGPQNLPPQFRRRLPPQMRERELRRTGLGSGFIVTSDGIILTNNHVVSDSEELEVVLDDGRKFKAKVKGADPESEVAVIQIEASNLPTLEIGDSDKIRVGNFCIAIGSPQGLSQSVTFGIISALNRSELNITDFGNFIQTEASINQGNSGGPLLDDHGRVIGINTAIVSTTGGSQGLGLAIPINQARAIYTQLLKTGKVQRGYLGIMMQELDPDLADSMGAKDKTGAVVLEVKPNTPATGILEVNDIIVGVNGQPVKGSHDVMNRVAAIAPGDKVKLSIIRQEKEKNVEIKLGTRPSREELLNGKTTPVPSVEKGESQDFDLGFTAEPLTPEKAKELNLSSAKGLVITKVDEGSAAAKRGLRPGMVIDQVNQKDVRSLKDLSAAIKDSSRKSVVLRITDGQGSQLVVLPKK